MLASPLTSIEISLSAGARPFFYRPQSGTDKAVIEQIFVHQHYNLLAFPQSVNLRSYADSIAAGGASLLVVDAGANIGASAIYLADIDRRIHVCAIEPERQNFLLLEKNCAGLPITAIEGAISSKPGKTWLGDPGIGEWGFRTGGTTGQYQVDAVMMSHVLARFDARQYKPLICKIDIEGGEGDLFSDNVGWIDRFPLVVIELHDVMFPGANNSKNFLRAISKRNFDFIYRGENVFCFNSDLLFGRSKHGQTADQGRRHR
jgi:FkbM family methyltransferase